ncbi:MAG: DUF2024 family protein [Verrucomicrobia bacterium]|nr:DUF2024 family protein [Verrucomicrobiota bacterium]
MEIAVYDTYVVKKNGERMHFDVIVPKGATHEKAIQHGREYLKKIGQDGQTLTARECEFCHIENASPKIEKAIQESGCFICEMEGCR